MLNNEVEKKCSLLARFVTENLDTYAQKVRDNLSVYLNTAEKIRLRISRNAVTLTDRTIWHNKIERVPVSLIRECKVDHTSPKICYFVNETITNKYQVVALLCKSSEDSHKLMTILQHKLNSQGHYRAHSEWLRNGSFRNTGQTTPKTKHKTMASVAIVESPKLVTRFAWGLPRQATSLQQTTTTPSSIRSSRRGDLDSTFDYDESEAEDDEDHDYVPINEILASPVSPPIIVQKQQNQKHSSAESQKFKLISRQLEPLPDPPRVCNEYQWQPLQHETEPPDEVSHPESPMLSRRSHAHYQDHYNKPVTAQNQRQCANSDANRSAYYSQPATPTPSNSDRQSKYCSDVFTNNGNHITEQHAYLQPSKTTTTNHKRPNSFSYKTTTTSQISTRHSFRMPSRKFSLRTVNNTPAAAGSVFSEEEENMEMVMRMPRYERRSSMISFVEQRGGYQVSMSEVMRSSVVQYDSDVDNPELIQPDTAAVQHNSNGIARVVVGGNEVTAPDINNSVTQSTADSKSTDKETSTDTKPDKGDDEEDLVITEPESADDNHIPVSRQNGDGATSPDFTILTQTTGAKAVTHQINSPLSDNTLDGIYDNLRLTSPDRTPTAEQEIPLSVEELLKSCEMEDNHSQVMQNDEKIDRSRTEKESAPDKKPLDAAVELKDDIDDDDDDEYELVLTGLKQLTKGSNKSDTQAETRYPHQIIAAMATNDSSKNRSVTDNEKAIPTQTTAIPTVPTHITPIPLPTPSQTSLATPAATPTPAVKMRSRSTQPDNSTVSDNSKRPQSVSSGLHLIRTNNDLRRSVRRKGQYKSIAEYEKLNNNAGNNGVINVESDVKVVNPKPIAKPRDSLHSTSHNDSTYATPPPPLVKRTPQPVRHVRNPPTTPEMHRSINSLSGMQSHGHTNTSLHQSDQVKMRAKDGKTHSSHRNLVQDSEAGSRRQSIISISSVPNHVVLRRVDSKLADLSAKADKRADTDRRSRSFDRKKNYSLEEGVIPQGLTLVGSRNSLVSHGRSQTNISSHQSQKHHRSKDRTAVHQLSLGEPNTTPILDGKRKSNSAQRTRTAPLTGQHPSSHISGLKKQQSRSHYVSLPNQPDLAFYRHQHLTTPQFNWNGVSWDQNPGFKRFFDSILTYGPNGTKAATKESSKYSKVHAHNNQPDIVLESLNHDLKRADDSDSENSSIRSSASAYWPPELKLQCNNGEDFEEETASWQFHNVIGHHPINAS